MNTYYYCNISLQHKNIYIYNKIYKINVVVILIIFIIVIILIYLTVK